MVGVVVVDAGSQFRGAFEEMCECLQITFWSLSCGNRKGNSIEKYHRFLNKTQDITGQDSGRHDVFIQNSKHRSMHGTAPQYMIRT